MEINTTTSRKLLRGLPDLYQFLEAVVQLAGDGGLVVTFRIPLFRVWRPIDPATVLHLGRIAQIAVIVQLPYLVAEIDERNAARAHGNGIREHDSTNGFILSVLETGERGRGTGNAAVSCSGVVLEGYAARKTARMAVDVKGIQEATVIVAVLAKLSGVFVRKGPANVVMRSDIVDPGAAACDVVTTFYCQGEQGYVSRGHSLPGKSHLQWVVGQLTFMGVDVLHDSIRMHDRFRLEKNRRRRYATESVETAQQLMSLGEVLTVSVHLLPHECDSVHPKEVDSNIGEIQHFASHRTKDRRVGVIQIPLKVIKGRPHPTSVGKLDE